MYLPSRLCCASLCAARAFECAHGAFVGFSPDTPASSHCPKIPDRLPARGRANTETDNCGQLFIWWGKKHITSWNLLSKSSRKYPFFTAHLSDERVWRCRSACGWQPGHFVASRQACVRLRVEWCSVPVWQVDRDRKWKPGVVWRR